MAKGDDRKKTAEVIAESFRLRDDILKFVNGRLEGLRKKHGLADGVSILHIGLSQALMASVMTAVMSEDDDLTNKERLQEIRNEALVEAVQLLRATRIGESEEPE